MEGGTPLEQAREPPFVLGGRRLKNESLAFQQMCTLCGSCSVEESFRSEGVIVSGIKSRVQ